MNNWQFPKGVLTAKCLYALNQALDDERSRRALAGITDEASWSLFHEDLRDRWPTGALADKCGRDAVVLVIELWEEKFCLPYCARCFRRDMAVVNGKAFVLRLAPLSDADIETIHHESDISRGFPDHCESFEIFERAIKAYTEWRKTV